MLRKVGLRASVCALALVTIAASTVGAQSACPLAGWGVREGMFGLLGRNGAGKSTLMRILATLQEPDEGSGRLRNQLLDLAAGGLGHGR